VVDVRKDLVIVAVLAIASETNVDWHDDQRYYLGETVAGVGLLNLVHEFVFGCVERGRVYDATVIRWWQALIAVTDYSVWTTK
jgi:hypothetical protein